MKTLHIVPHVHWDREWYFTDEESKVYLSKHLDEVLTMLENDNNYPYYVLDGQTSILEDYFEDRPEEFERVQMLAKEGKLILGPWYTQTDTMLVQGESIVRNLYFGYKDCMELGNYMKIGYLPDSFGHCSRMPMILNGFDIPYSMFWRGISKRHDVKNSEFYWTSEDGSKVFVQMLPLCYALGRFLPTDREKLKNRMDMTIKALAKYSATDEIILPNGHDQMPIQTDIHEVIEKMKELYPEINIKLNCYENVMDIQKQNKGFKTISGEFLDSETSRIHRSIYSTRMDLKIKNAILEHKITNSMEPIATIAYLVGFNYPHGLIEKIWKELLKNHAHDSLGGCCSDKVNQQIDIRFNNVEEKSTNIMNFAMRLIAEHQKGIDKERLLAFNTLPYERDTVIEAEISTRKIPFTLTDSDGNEINYDIVSEEKIDATVVFRELRRKDENGNFDPFTRCKIKFRDKVPAFGYKTYILNKCNSKDEYFEELNEIEDDYFKIKCNQNGTLNIYDKKNDLTYDQVCKIVDDGDDGDEYDYSPPEKDWVIDNCKNVEVKGEKRTHLSKLKVSTEIAIPSDLNKRAERILDSKLEVKYETALYNDGLIRFKIEISNNANDHRVRLLIPTNIASDFSYANDAFGEIKRPVVDEMMNVWEVDKWEERPDSIYPMIDYVYLKDNKHGLGLMSNGSREYEIVGEKYDTIALTVFRSVGFCGKSDLKRRPGRLSGIALETPDAQLHKKITFDFSLYTFKSEKNNISFRAKEYFTPINTYNHMEKQSLAILKKDVITPLKKSLLDFDVKNTTISTIKKCENKEGIIIRLYNVNEPVEEIKVNSLEKDQVLMECNLREDIIKELENKTLNNIKKNQVRTMLIKTEKRLCQK